MSLLQYALVKQQSVEQFAKVQETGYNTRQSYRSTVGTLVLSEAVCDIVGTADGSYCSVNRVSVCLKPL